MSHKEAKAERKLEKELGEKEIVGEFHITAYSNGDVTINGPIGNLFFFRKVMNIAEKAVLEAIDNAIEDEQIKQKIIRLDPTKFMAFPPVGKSN